MCEFGLLFGCHQLATDGFIFVNVEVKHMDMSVSCDSSKYGRGIWCPGDISYWTVEVKGEHRLSENKRNMLPIIYKTMS